MQLVPGRILAESRLSLRHVERVLDAVAPGTSLRHVMVAQCYVTQNSYIHTALEAWKESFKHQVRSFHLIHVSFPSLPLLVMFVAVSGMYMIYLQIQNTLFKHFR